MLLVRVDTEAGVTGWGRRSDRTVPATRAAIDTLLGPVCIGRDPGRIEAITEELRRVPHGGG